MSIFVLFQCVTIIVLAMNSMVLSHFDNFNVLLMTALIVLQTVIGAIELCKLLKTSSLSSMVSC